MIIDQKTRFWVWKMGILFFTTCRYPNFNCLYIFLSNLEKAIAFFQPHFDNDIDFFFHDFESDVEPLTNWKILLMPGAM